MPAVLLIIFPLAGFDATAEEIGLTEEQLRLAKSRRDERARDTC